MTRYIPRHDLGRDVEDDLWESIEENRDLWADRLDNGANSIDACLDSFYLDAMYAVHADPDAARIETWEAWATAMQMHHAFFMLTANPPGTQLELMVNHKIRRPVATGPSSLTNADKWTTTFYLAVICRDQQRYRQLCEIPVDLLREAGESNGAQYDPFIYHWISAVQAFVLNRPGLDEELLAAMELSTPERSAFGSPDVLDMVVFPELNTFLGLVERDTDKFNQALAQGLELFRAYQTSDEKRTRRISSVVSLPLLGLACLAYDTAEHDPDFRMEVTSGYLPKHLLERSWHGEFAI